MSVITNCQAYSLLGTQWKYIGNGYKGNRNPVFSSETLKGIARENEKSVAQVVLRWALQGLEIGILPSSSKKHRIQENMELDFELDPAALALIDHIK